MTLLELRDERGSFLELVRSMVNITQGEKRKMTELEETEVK